MFCTQSPRVLGAKHVLDPEYIPFNPRFCTCDWFARPRPGAPCGRCTRIKRDAAATYGPHLTAPSAKGQGLQHMLTHTVPQPAAASACAWIPYHAGPVVCRAPSAASCRRKAARYHFPIMELRKMPACINVLLFSSVQFKLSSAIMFNVQAHLVWSLLGIILFLFDDYIHSSVQVNVLVTAN